MAYAIFWSVPKSLTEDSPKPNMTYAIFGSVPASLIEDTPNPNMAYLGRCPKPTQKTERFQWGALQAGRFASGVSLAVFSGSLLAARLIKALGPKAYVLWGTAASARGMMGCLIPMALGTGRYKQDGALRRTPEHRARRAEATVTRAEDLGLARGEAAAVVQAIGAAGRGFLSRRFDRTAAVMSTVRLGAPQLWWMLRAGAGKAPSASRALRSRRLAAVDPDAAVNIPVWRPSGWWGVSNADLCARLDAALLLRPPGSVFVTEVRAHSKMRHVRGNSAADALSATGLRPKRRQIIVPAFNSSALDGWHNWSLATSKTGVLTTSAFGRLVSRPRTAATMPEVRTELCSAGSAGVERIYFLELASIPSPPVVDSLQLSTGRDIGQCFGSEAAGDFDAFCRCIVAALLCSRQIRRDSALVAQVGSEDAQASAIELAGAQIRMLYADKRWVAATAARFLLGALGARGGTPEESSEGGALTSTLPPKGLRFAGWGWHPRTGPNNNKRQEGPAGISTELSPVGPERHPAGTRTEEALAAAKSDGVRGLLFVFGHRGEGVLGLGWGQGAQRTERIGQVGWSSEESQEGG
ncbi:unnamed protein product [Polarella glacialis]|uniref:Uncharacterized protein n=1 Tax=Polarella glacialis TaxID=89957 RepID=A0A813IKY0_POLGL|nr:unnamed protein product [Polarella glacialis]